MLTHLRATAPLDRVKILFQTGSQPYEKYSGKSSISVQGEAFLADNVCPLQGPGLASFVLEDR